MLRAVPHARAAIGLGAILLLALASAPAPASAEPVISVGGPVKADVRMKSLMGVPPEGYSLFCTSQPGCTTSGNIDLETQADFPVAYDPHTQTTHGSGDLSYSKAEGTVRMSWSCSDQPGQYVSEVTVADDHTGELGVTRIDGDPGANSISVTLDADGESNGAYPRETVKRTDGGCGAPIQKLDQLMGTWYYDFYLTHTGTTQGGNVKISGLTWKDGVYTKTFDRFVNVGQAPFTYPLYERTTIEVEPEYCKSKQNQIAYATSGGKSLNLDGMRLFAGQQFTAPGDTDILMADGSEIRLKEGGTFSISDCAPNDTELTLSNSIGRLWVHLKHTLAGSDKKFQVKTKRSVAGVRGTIFALSYDKAKELTKVTTIEHQVSLKGRNGAKGSVMIQEGQTGVQQGTSAPRIVKR